MKKFLAFIKWHYKSWSFTQKIWMLGGGCFGYGLPDYLKTNEVNTAMILACCCWGTVFLKWFVWDSIKASWLKYKQHRNELFNTIKSSDC